MTHPLKLLVRQADTVLHTDFISNSTLLAENGDALDLDAVLDDAGGVASNGSRCALDTRPSTDLAVPADDGVQDASVVLDLRVFKNDRLLDTYTSANDDAGADGDVGTDLGGWVDLRGGVDVDGREDVCRGGGELF